MSKTCIWVRIQDSARWPLLQPLSNWVFWKGREKLQIGRVSPLSCLNGLDTEADTHTALSFRGLLWKSGPNCSVCWQVKLYYSLPPSQNLLILLGPPVYLPISASFCLQSGGTMPWLTLFNLASNTYRMWRSIGIDTAWDHISVLWGKTLLQSGARI